MNIKPHLVQIRVPTYRDPSKTELLWVCRVPGLDGIAAGKTPGLAVARLCVRHGHPMPANVEKEWHAHRTGIAERKARWEDERRKEHAYVVAAIARALATTY